MRLDDSAFSELLAGWLRTAARDRPPCGQYRDCSHYFDF